MVFRSVCASEGEFTLDNWNAGVRTCMHRVLQIACTGIYYGQVIELHDVVTVMVASYT